MSSSNAGTENLISYRQARADAFSELSASEKVKWETAASEHNEHIKDLPLIEHIFE
jgi:hypothetical protein